MASKGYYVAVAVGIRMYVEENLISPLLFGAGQGCPDSRVLSNYALDWVMSHGSSSIMSYILWTCSSQMLFPS